MHPSPKQTAADFAKASVELRKKFRSDPEQAKKFLIGAGIAVRSKKSPTGITLAKPFR
jgi:hypothetical protein